ncbi:cupin domain-containing protein [Halovenus rubra]|uniref:Cupin domain-containing protein n=2 Tax=Halovenus rubra TaxID=869890 RepID=A0ACC7E4M1_9EURY|nr:cupin domain-containing protein [Halovenus rubra]
MSHDMTTYDEVEPLAPGMHFLRDELDCDNLGLTVLDAEAGWEGKEHDHAEDGEEEVYLLVDGSGTLTVDGKQVGLDAGDAVRVDPGATRRLTFDQESTMVIAGAP